MVRAATTLPEDRLDAAVLEAWLADLPQAEDEASRRRLQGACGLALERFEGKVERTGQPLALYALHVADILARLGMDDDTLAIAVLHRFVSGGLADEAEIRERFGEEIARLVVNMVRIDRVVPGVLAGREKEKADYSESLRRMLLDMSDDVRVLLLLLAERLHLMRRLKHLALDIQQQFSRNTRDIFAPIANRLGVWKVKWELEDLALRFLEPDDYRDIANRLDGRRQERLDYLREINEILQKAFAAEGIAAEISARPKHIYSIWRKMRRKDVDFGHIFDVRAVRVMVGTVAECYAALGVVHSIWRHIPGEFDDYIATPKANMYQSIHTVVIGPGEKPLEIQIRTRDMHEHAESGVAAHWRYKEQSGSTHQLERRIQWLRQWLESREEGESGGALARDVFAEEEAELVYVLTPQGKVIELPFGATPVDFAYAVHTAVGHRCRGAKVDGRIVPLTHRLESGSTVEILTAKEGGPSRDWLRPASGYVQSPRARQSVRQWFKQQDLEKHAGLGKAALERELTRQGRDKPKMDEVLGRFNFKTADDLYAALGRGDLSVGQVAGMGGLHDEPGAEAKAEELVAERPRRTRRRAPGKGGEHVRVQGVDDLMTVLGKCCKPVPGDPIIRYITRGRGVTVHRVDCRSVTHLGEEDRQRLIDVAWGDEKQSAAYAVDVRITAVDRKGLLRDISSVFSNEDVDVTGVKTHTDTKRHQALMTFTVQVMDMRQLERLLEKLLQVPDVLEARRGE